SPRSCRWTRKRLLNRAAFDNRGLSAQVASQLKRQPTNMRAGDGSSSSFRRSCRMHTRKYWRRSENSTPQTADNSRAYGTTRLGCGARNTNKANSFGVGPLACADVHTTHVEIDVEIGGVERACGIGRCAHAPPQHRAAACEQLVGVERLHDVVVGARIKRFDRRLLTIVAGHHDDVHVRRRPNVPTKL